MRLLATALVVPFAVGVLTIGAAPAAADKKGQEIGVKVDKAWSGYKGEDSEIDLELVSPSGDKAVRRMIGKAREDGSDEQSVMTITWPADQKGTRLLTWNHRKTDDDQWLYMVSIQRVKRISARGQTGSFMGSEFAFEDLVNVWWVDKYDWKFIKDVKVGARDTWLVERVPKDHDSGYSKQVVWIDKEYLSALRMDFYDRKGKLFKTALFKSFKKYGDKWRSDRIEMDNKQTGKKSNCVWKKRAMGKSIPAGEFSPDSLGN
jgi:Outer membrane lipoprotein-sorting protein